MVLGFRVLGLTAYKGAGLVVGLWGVECLGKV